MELELFFKNVESSIRERYITFLSDIKCFEFQSKKVVKTKKDKKFKKKAKKYNPNYMILKNYSAGVDMALSVLNAEFKSFKKRLKKEEKDGSKF